jgi:hypothetical protein
MRRLALLIAAAAVAVFAFAVPAAAAPGTAGHGSQRCTATYNWHTGTHIVSLERYGVADWETQCTPKIGMQLKIGCHSFVTGQTYADKSGIVYALETNDETHCSPTDAGLFLAIRFDVNGVLGSWHTLCSPCGGWSPARAATGTKTGTFYHG